MPERPPLRDYSRSRAVIMGTSEYLYLPGVPAALNSLDRIRELLTGPLCGWPAERVMSLSNERGPGDLPDRLITSFEDATEIALFYYVGHGQIDRMNQLCLGLVGSRPEFNRRAATSLPFEAVRRALLESPAAMKVVILDCCFAGLASMPANSLGASPEDVLDRTDGAGAYTMAASAANSPAWFDTNPGAVRPQTFFTQYLADLVQDGIPGQPAGLRLHPLFARLRDRLATDQRPVPVERSVDAAREFVFAHNAAPPEVQRDVDRELVELSQRLAEAEARSAAAEAAREQAHLLGEAREQALRAEIAARTHELERLREQARIRPAMPTEEREELDEAIDEAQRLLDETTAAHEDSAADAESSQRDGLPVAHPEVTHEPRERATDRSVLRPTRLAQPKSSADAALQGDPAEILTAPPPPGHVGAPRVSVRDLPPDVQLRLWRIRTVIMVIVGAALAGLTRSWEISLTVAILAGIIDAVYRSRNASHYLTGRRPGARRRTGRQLTRMRSAGYVSLGGRPVPGSREVIDHLVIGPSGVYAIDSERWEAKLAIRVLNGRRLYLGAESQKDRLEHASWEASQISELLSDALGAPITVRAALAVYGPKVPWDIATVRGVDVFTGQRLRKYLKRRGPAKNGTAPLTREEVVKVYDTASRVLPQSGPQAVTPVA